MKRVVVGLSGGVDSSVAAYLLKKQGYEVIGLFMKNWHDNSVTISSECPWLQDSNDALNVAEKIEIPFQVVDLSESYQERIIDYMFDEYEKGRTPNPDILCNREIKFDAFLEIATSLGADYVATGHYCRKEKRVIEGKSVYSLLAGRDLHKDQSYFLCQLSETQLKKALFPVGHLNKSEVRQIAREAELITAEKKDSQGLCFVGKVKLPEFLKQKLKTKQGIIIQVDNDSDIYQREVPKFLKKEDELNFYATKFKYHSKIGRVVGIHQGAHFFTKGQRKGLAVGGTKEPLFVIETDVDKNIVYAGEGRNHRGLFRNVLYVVNTQVHWIRDDLKLQLHESMPVLARIRYRQPLEVATLYQADNGIYVAFKNPQSAIQEGQFVAWYQDRELLGSGVIS